MICHDCEEKIGKYWISCSMCGERCIRCCDDCASYRCDDSPYGSHVCSVCINTQEGKRYFDQTHALFLRLKNKGEKYPIITTSDDTKAILKIPSIQE